MFNEFTGRTRHRIQKVRAGFFNTKELMVLQHEVKGVKIQYAAGQVDSYTDIWWVDSRPEWLLTKSPQQVKEEKANAD